MGLVLNVDVGDSTRRQDAKDEVAPVTVSSTPKEAVHSTGARINITPD